jgi:pimeloyl-ACP methyl ester carboxylesterase
MFPSIDIARGFDTCCNLATAREIVFKPGFPDDGSAVSRDYSAASDVLLVSFSGLKRNPAKLPGFSLRGTLTGFPVNKLYLRDLDRAWFLRGLSGLSRDVSGTAAFLRAEAKSMGARRVVLTGYSLGGFAALLYGALIGADEVHAISPQTFISFWRRWRSGDHRWQRYVWPLHFGTTRRYHDLRPLLSGSSAQTRFHIHFARDSRLDAIHAGHVRDLPGVITHEHTKGSHRLVSELRERGELRAILERAVTGDSLQGGSGKI